MKAVVEKGKSRAIIYDASIMDGVDAAYFSVDYWKRKDAIAGEAVGRGSAWFIDAPFGPVVMRKFLRGGWVAKLSRQSYFYSGVERSRPFKEFRVLVKLTELGLPVPRPVAAICEHRGLVSSGALITARIPDVTTLADLIIGNKVDPDSLVTLWERIGACIRQFHDAGVWHADLNARNILLDDQLQVFLIDFDRAKFSPDNAVDGAGNLNRLKRSLAKFWPADGVPDMQASWTLLEAGYHD